MEIVEKHNKQWLVTCSICDTKYKVTLEDFAKAYKEGNIGIVDEKTKYIDVWIKCPACSYPTKVPVLKKDRASVVEIDDTAKSEEKKEIVLVRDMIKFIKYKRGFTDAELGKRLGVSQASVSAWARGANSPRTDMAAAITDLYERTAKYF